MNALRGAIVVIVALIIGVVVLARGLDEPEAANDPNPPAPAAPSGDPQPATGPQTPEVTQPQAPPAEPAPDDMFVPVAPAEPTELDIAPVAPPPEAFPYNRNEVRVLVANGTSVCGAAGRLVTLLSAEGYNVQPGINGPAADESAMFYVETYDANAAVIANTIQLDPAFVLPMPTPPPDELGDAHVLIHIGADDLAQANC